MSSRPEHGGEDEVEMEIVIFACMGMRWRGRNENALESEEPECDACWMSSREWESRYGSTFSDPALF
jgi:hypothetical protein